MFEHQQILDKIELIETFFDKIGIKKIEDIPKNWNLDSSRKFTPKINNFTIDFKGEERILLSVNVFLVGGIHFTVSGKMGVSVAETIQTDYDFKSKFEDYILFREQFRNFKLNRLIDEIN